MSRLCRLWLAACLVTPVSPVLAQQSIDFASIGGRVTDPSGAVVPGAAVTARHDATNIATHVVTDTDGRFRFSTLRSGDYQIVVRQPGFNEASHRLTLTAGAAFEVPISLELGAIDSRVTVLAQPATLETARSQIAGTVTRTEVRDLPLNGRNFLELALLVPGVSPTNVASPQLFPETSAVPGVTVSVSSQRNLSNNFLVDGLSANDDAAALSGITYGVDAIEQLQVVTSGGQAELGRALGGYVNIVTRSGTNARQGDVYVFGRDDRLNARNPLSGTTLPMHQAQFGISLGGPIAQDRTFYFVNAEQRQLGQSGLTTIQPAAAGLINARLTTIGYRGRPVETGVYANPLDSTNLLAKINHRLHTGHELGVRYSAYTTTSANSRGAGALNAPSASAGLENLDQSLAATHTRMMSSRTLFETRAQVAHGDLRALPSDPIGPAVSIAGVASFGTLSSSPTRRGNTLYQGVANLSHQTGAHALRSGVDVLHNQDRITYPRSVRGSYTFASLAAFMAGTYNNGGFTQTFGDSEVAQSNPNVGVYLQDEWKLGSRLTLNLGLRYDLQFLETIAADTDNISPRLGVAWVPSASRRTLVRGSAGLFYDRVPLRPLANALLSAGNTTDLRLLRQIGVTLSPAQTGAPLFPNVLDAVVPSQTPINLTTMDPQLENAYARQASLEVEQQLGTRTTVSVAYQYTRGLGLLMSINQNVPACIAAGTNNGCRPNAAYANNNQYSAAGSSNYHGLHVSWLLRPARWGQYRVSYTLSTSKNNVGEFFFSSPIDPFDLSKDWGRSDDDQRHRLVVNGAVRTSSDPGATTWARITRGFQVSGSLQTYSAVPFNITSGVTTVQGTPGRPMVDGRFIPRNAGVGSGFLSLNARLSRTFRVTGRVGVEALAEGFNLTNRRNVIARNTNFGPGAYPSNPSPTFGQVTAVGEPRALQIGLRVHF